MERLHPLDSKFVKVYCAENIQLLVTKKHIHGKQLVEDQYELGILV